LGRRIARTKNGTTDLRLVYQDFLQPIATVHADGSVDSRFVYATMANVPDYMVRSGQTYRIITDHLGSVRLVVNTDSGAIAQQIDYDEWGNVLLDTSPGFQPFGYAGGLYDPDTGLVRFGYRDYDAQTGRWLAKDPILFAGGSPNLYSYCHNDPINWVDPFGLAEEIPPQNPPLNPPKRRGGIANTPMGDILSLWKRDNITVSLDAELTLGRGLSASANKDYGGINNGFDIAPTYGLSAGIGATFSLLDANNSGFTETYNFLGIQFTFDEHTDRIVGFGVSVGPGVTIFSKTRSRLKVR
jgi:RHS repeat-associated protein